MSRLFPVSRPAAGSGAALTLAGLLLAGTAGADCLVVTDNPANGCIGEVRLESPQMSITGQSADIAAGQAVQFSAQAFTGPGDPAGRAPTPCDGGWNWQVFDATGGALDPSALIVEGNSMRIVPRNNPGISRVQATCRDNPSITDEVGVRGGLTPPPAPTAVTPTPVTPTPITPTAVTPTAVTPTEISATPVTPTEVAPTAVGGSGASTALIVGGAVVLGVGLAAAAASALETEEDSSGGGDACGVTLEECCTSGGGVSVVYCAMPAECGCPAGTTQKGGDNIGNVNCYCP
jgi:hypothetical protein